MSHHLDRRARKKARTRQEILRAAHGLFAQRGHNNVTIADIAATADVAVQTVFNHFPTKEELFFSDRAPWVEGIPAAVRDRAPGVPPLTALRIYLVDTVGAYVEAALEDQHREMVALMEASPALAAYERELHHQAVCRLTTALEEAWTDEQPGPVSSEFACAIHLGAATTAEVWLAAVRALLMQQRAVLAEPERAQQVGAAVSVLVERALGRLEQGLIPPDGFTFVEAFLSSASTSR